ncbi:cytochrome p450 [Pyrenophora tritici-repentis]|nr:cytochrome p450 [Pyrenophora tritici-repentis]
MAWKLVTRLRSNTFVEYICDEVLDTPGRTVEMNLLGSDIFITDRAENIKAIQADQFADFAKGQTPHDVFSSILGDSVFTTDGPLWKTSREQLEPHVSRVRSDDIPTAEKHMQRLLRRIKNSPEKVDVFDVVDRFQLDLVSQVFLGESTDSLSAKEQPFRKAMEELLTFNTNRLLFGRLANLFPDWLFVPKAYRDLTKYVNDLIDKTLALPINNQTNSKAKKEFNLVEDLVTTHPNDRYFIRGQLIAVLMASKDPSAILTTWTIYHLARQPALYRRLQQEIEDHIGMDAIPTVEQLRKLDLLANTIKESMRMYHPLGLNIREARKDAVLPVGGGSDGNQPISVSAGQIIGLQRSKTIVGADADVWDPTRWESWSPKYGHYLPFSIGPRQCPGRVFGRFQIQYILVRLLQEFQSVTLCGNGDNSMEEMKIKVELNLKSWKEVYGHRKPGQLENLKHPGFVAEVASGIIAADTESHTYQRHLLAPAFSVQGMQRQEPLIRRHVDRLFSCLEEHCSEGRSLDLAKWFNFFSFDVIGDLSFGESFGNMERKEFHPWIATIMEFFVAQHDMAHFRRAYPLLEAMLDPVVKAFAANIIVKHDVFMRTQIEKRLALEPSREDFIDVIKPDHARGKQGLSLEAICHNASIFVVAGSETTAIAHPRILAKLKEEIDSSFDSEEKITLMSVKRLKYLAAVLEETLRIYPAATNVDIWHWAMYHNPANFTEPEVFAPERWLGDPRFKGDKKAAFQPFSTGKRNCIGQK